MTKPLPYIILEKSVGETPLECAEKWRAANPLYQGVPLAYAGRLDPMASGQLLILIGDECKVQETYHGLDKAYFFTVLFGVRSDSGDVLGLVEESGQRDISQAVSAKAATAWLGHITLPYPIFSARTVKGKPLHTWAVEGRLGEITIPTKSSTVYTLEAISSRCVSRRELVSEALSKVESIKPVTDPRKALGNDFRRSEVRQCWEKIRTTGLETDIFTLTTFRCVASSGTYMRTLAEEIAKSAGTVGLAFGIERTIIGRYDKETLSWTNKF